MATHTPAPVEQFRSELIERLLACAPQSVLDVGCGDGTLLVALAPRVARVAGVETDAICAEAARARGFEVQVADACRLPHANGAFDWVVLQNTAHHLAALDAAMRECWRVARVGVLVQDPWYDESFVSQRIGRALDRWYKSIDRLEGMVHEDCLDAVTICGTLAAEPGIAIEVRHRLLLQAVPFAELVREVDRRLRSGHVPASLETEARAILEDAERHGVSEPGMLMVSLRRSA
jgi:SAM-dependent methyltransferase